MELQEFKIKVIPLRNKLFRFAKRFLDNVEEAEDTVQEVYIRLWNMRNKLDQYRSVEALAMVTTRNMCLDRLKSKRYTTERIENLRDDVVDAAAEKRNDQAELVLRIQRLIQTLPELQRTIMQLRDIEGYDFEEIAGIMGMNENAIRVNLSRARKKIREIITGNKKYEYQGN
jgi:RNA polymerase sigma-70 factor, ECF subfamily